MDTSETYTKMCEKAEELQKPRSLMVGDYLKYRNAFGYMVIGTGSIPYIVNKVLEQCPIWLPRQDQLQEMVGGFSALETFWGWCFDDIGAEYEPCPIFKLPVSVTSMEQLWLAFVMKERYQKIWDGENWNKV